MTTIRTNVFPVPDLILPGHVLVNTHDNSLLDFLVALLLSANPKVVFYSTGQPGKLLQEILGPRARSNYIAIEDFTGCSEIEGGFEALHHKIYMGLSAQRGNPAHEEYLRVAMAEFGQGPGVYFDLFVGNLENFDEVISKEGISAEIAEIARCHVDVGVSAMAMASARNWHSVASLISPSRYTYFGEVLHKNQGRVPASVRFELATQTMEAVAFSKDDENTFFDNLDFKRDVLPSIKLV